MGLVVGLPVHASGAESQKSTESRGYGRWLAETTGLPVRFFDERYSSQSADRALLEGALTGRRRKLRRDMVAAQIMLAAYLEYVRQGNRGEGTEPWEDPLAGRRLPARNSWHLNSWHLTVQQILYVSDALSQQVCHPPSLFGDRQRGRDRLVTAEALSDMGNIGDRGEPSTGVGLPGKPYECWGDHHLAAGRKQSLCHSAERGAESGGCGDSP